ncbi:MAG: SDR family oxidoreductase [Robiginitomaculum sp.]|nr:SDR family oxidoreductase [Robiginitomaculum sp.]
MRRVLVTGGGARIGQALCVELARAGFYVIVHYNTSRKGAEQTLEQIQIAGGTGEAVQADLSVHDQCLGLWKQIGTEQTPVHALINNASLFENDHLNEISEQSWDRHFAINAKAPVFLSQGFAEQLPSDQTGHVVNILDQRLAKLNPDFFSYTLSKAVLGAATTTMAQALAPQIRVNAVAPGPTLANARQSADDFAKQQQAGLLQHGSPVQEIVDAVMFLLNSNAITGQTITVDGGQSLMWQTADIIGVRE